MIRRAAAGGTGDEFEEPFVVDHGRFERAFGDPTPLRGAIRATVDWYRQRRA